MTAMHPRTKKTLEELENVIWFRQVGVNDNESALVLHSWTEALEYCTAPEWLALCFEAANRFGEQVLIRDAGRYAEWNVKATQLSPIVSELIGRKTKRVVAENNLPKVFLDCVYWDMLHLLLEAEYSDLVMPGFFASQAYWYVNGHFPCGWIGSFPNGRLVVY